MIGWGWGLDAPPWAKPRRRLTRVRIPLHLDPADQSTEAMARRYNLHADMASLNPKGFRTPGKRDGITKAPKKQRGRKGYALERLARGLAQRLESAT